MWVHSSLRQYIEARPWLLEILSLNILSPTYYRDTLIHIPGSSCPYLTANSVKQNTYISNMLASSVYTDSKHLIAQAANSTYYSFTLTPKGDYVQSEIPQLYLMVNILVTSLL